MVPVNWGIVFHSESEDGKGNEVFLKTPKVVGLNLFFTDWIQVFKTRQDVSGLTLDYSLSKSFSDFSQKTAFQDAPFYSVNVMKDFIKDCNSVSSSLMLQR